MSHGPNSILARQGRALPTCGICLGACLIPVLACHGAVSAGETSSPSAGAVYLVPHSHIDVVWLWRFDPETIHRCCKPTFSRAVENLARFPEYVFCQSQVPLYEATERVYPDLFRKMEEYIREGRWEIVGGMYVEAEGGEPCGESLVRQCVLGKRYFKQRFGVDVTTGWQVDAWSHPGQLPQILAKSGINSYMFRRGTPGEDLFWWQSPDGSRVLACRPHNDDSTKGWLEHMKSIKERYGVNAAMVEMGRGDHGGGLDAKEIQAALDFAKEAAPDITVSFSTFKRYVDAVLAQKPRLPVIDTELGFELEGDLTNCGEIKKSNRECENALLTAEKWSTLAHMTCAGEYPAQELEEAWKKLLFNQFHDVLGGSLIPPAFDDAMVLYRSVRESAAEATNAALKALAKRIDTRGPGTPVIVFNPLPWTRTDLVEVDLAYPEAPSRVSLRDAKGRSTPVQVLERSEVKGKQHVRYLFIARDVPSLGYAVYHLAPEEQAPDNASSSPSASASALENDALRVEIDPASGWVSRIFDKQRHREVLDESGKGNQLLAIEDEGDSEGRFVLRQDRAPRPPGQAVEIDSKPSIQLIESGPVRATLRVEKTFRNSRFVQLISLAAGSSRVDFTLDMDWHDVHTMIKVAFPFALKDPEVTYDAPYAAIVRPADGNEYPAQKWVDMCADGSGAGLLNDARYAHDAQGSVLRMSVLRSPTQPANNTDEGSHTLGYAIYPHKDSWKKANVLRQGYAFNYPLMARVEPPHEGDWPAQRSFFAVEPNNVLLEVVKKAYDSDAVIVRLCEMHGEKAAARLTLPASVLSASETDLIEKPLRELPASGATLEFPMNPYEIKTIRAELRP